MSLVQNFLSEQKTLEALIDKISDGYSVVTIGNYLINEMIDMIEESLSYKDILEWWLFEDVEKKIYDSNGNEIADVTKLEDLYDYMVNNKY